jgi:Holliday junction DNA helicase RuvA
VDVGIVEERLVAAIRLAGAERLSLELRDKIDAVSAAPPAPQGPGLDAGGSNGAVRTEVVEALVALGFAAKQAEQAVDGVLAHGDADPATATVLRAALRTLGRKR